MSVKIKTFTETIAQANTGQALSQDLVSTDVVIQCQSTSAAAIFIGGSDRQDIEIPVGSQVSLSDVMATHGNKEASFKLTDIYIKSSSTSAVIAVMVTA